VLDVSLYEATQYTPRVGPHVPVAALGTGGERGNDECLAPVDSDAFEIAAVSVLNAHRGAVGLGLDGQ